MRRPLYQTVALSREEWKTTTSYWWWEYLSHDHGPVYLRNHISGPRNVETKNWLLNIKPSRHRSKRILKKLIKRYTLDQSKSLT